MRLTRRADFERLLRSGARRTLQGYTFITAVRDAGGPRLGLLVSRRHAPKAVQRNRIKRSIREAFRLERAKLGALDILVRPPLAAKASRDLVARLRTLFSHLAP
jgi:ribonuclease P protein component